MTAREPERTATAEELAAERARVALEWHLPLSRPEENPPPLSRDLSGDLLGLPGGRPPGCYNTAPEPCSDASCPEHGYELSPAPDYEPDGTERPGIPRAVAGPPVDLGDDPDGDNTPDWLPTDAELAEAQRINRECPYCGAKPGEPCVMAAGVMQTMHYSRDAAPPDPAIRPAVSGPSLADHARQLTDAYDQARPAPPSADWVRLAVAVLREVAAHPGFAEQLCPEGCGCRVGTEDADRFECGCDGPCCGDGAS